MLDFLNPTAAPAPVNYVEDPKKIAQLKEKALQDQNIHGKAVATKVRPDGEVAEVASDPINVDGVVAENPYKQQTPPAVQQEEVVEPIVRQAHEVIKQDREPAAEPKTKEMGMSDWLIGATPLLVDFLMGGNAGTKVSAEFFAKKGTDQVQSKEAYQLAIQKLKLQQQQEKSAGGGKMLTKGNVQWVDDGKGGKRLATYNDIVKDPSLQPLAEGSDELLKASQVGDYWDEQGKELVKATHSDALHRGLRPFNGTKYSTDNRANLDSLRLKMQTERKDAELANMNFDNQHSLLKEREHDPVTRSTRNLATNFEALQSAARRWAGDPKTRAVAEQELVVKYLKSLDPTSVARESEQLGVINSKGALDTINSFPERLKLGQRLTADQVRAIMESSRVRMQEQYKAQDELDGSYHRKGSQFGWDIGYGLSKPKVNFEDYDYLRKVGGSGERRAAKGTATYEKGFEEFKKKKLSEK